MTQLSSRSARSAGSARPVAAFNPRVAAPRIATGRSFWSWAIAGAIAAVLAGVLYARYLHYTNDWPSGAAWEVSVLRAVHVQLPYVVDELLLFIPWLGTNITILPGLAIASHLLVRRGRTDLVTVLIVAAAGNYVVGFALKYLFDRARPTLWPARGEFTGPSYPSGHAMMATSVLFVFAHLLHRERGWRWPYLATTLFGLATIFSRLYLGVHWPTDVLGGLLIGAVWLTAMLRAIRYETDLPADVAEVPRVAAPADELFEFEHRVPDTAGTRGRGQP